MIKRIFNPVALKVIWITVVEMVVFSEMYLWNFIWTIEKNINNKTTPSSYSSLFWQSQRLLPSPVSPWTVLWWQCWLHVQINHSQLSQLEVITCKHTISAFQLSIFCWTRVNRRRNYFVDLMGRHIQILFLFKIGVLAEYQVTWANLKC